jgi:hypothetical protein
MCIFYIWLIEETDGKNYLWKSKLDNHDTVEGMFYLSQLYFNFNVKKQIKYENIIIVFCNFKIDTKWAFCDMMYNIDKSNNFVTHIYYIYLYIINNSERVERPDKYGVRFQPFRQICVEFDLLIIG